MNTDFVKGPNNSELIIAQIQKLVVDGVLKPGEKLPSERKLAAQFSVSRASIKQTIGLMEERRMVKTRWNTGTIILDIFQKSLIDPLSDIIRNSSELTVDAVEIRYILEVEVTMLAAQRRSVQDLEKIEIAYNHLLAIFDTDDIEAQAHADVNFHFAIAEASHNKIFVHIMRSMTDLTHHDIIKNITFVMKKKDGKLMVNREHKAIYEAVLSGSSAAAEKACRIHLRQAGQPFHSRENL